MNYEELQRIQSLPDYLPSPEVEKEIALLLRSHTHAAPDAAQAHLVMQALEQLAERQWHTYETLPHAARKRLSAFLAGRWDRNSLESTRMLLGIISLLGLADALAHLTAADPASLDPAVAAAIGAAVSAFGDTVDNPYAEIKKTPPGAGSAPPQER